MLCLNAVRIAPQVPSASPGIINGRSLMVVPRKDNGGLRNVIGALVRIPRLLLFGSVLFCPVGCHRDDCSPIGRAREGACPGDSANERVCTAVTSIGVSIKGCGVFLDERLLRWPPLEAWLELSPRKTGIVKRLAVSSVV